MKERPSDYLSQSSGEYTIDRRGFLKCAVLGGSAAIWSINGGILTSTVFGEVVNIRSAALDDLYTPPKYLERQIPIPGSR
jgi:hypothetical protein